MEIALLILIAVVIFIAKALKVVPQQSAWWSSAWVNSMACCRRG